MNKIIKTKKFVYSLLVLLLVISLIGLVVYVNGGNQDPVISEDKKATSQTAPTPKSNPTPIPTQPPVLPEPQKPEVPPNASSEEQVSEDPWASGNECEEEGVTAEEDESELPADFYDPRQDPELRQMILDLKLTARGIEVLDDITQLEWNRDPGVDCEGNPWNTSYHSGDADFDWLQINGPNPFKSTLGHEFLHAVFARLPESEQRNLGFKLEEFYQANKTYLDRYTNLTADGYYYIRHPDYDIYDFEEIWVPNRHTEMYAIFGTEVFDVPSDLEEHYSQYFQDRKATFDLQHLVLQ